MSSPADAQPRTIAIGDVHGCAKALDAILVAIGPTARDLIVPLGDYVDRGPDSRGVIDRMLDLAKRCRLVPLLGNHEQMRMSAMENRGGEFDSYEFEIWLHCGGEETINSYGGLGNVPLSHLAFLETCRPYFETSTHIFVHANYDPDMALAEQPDHLTLWEHISRGVPAPHQSGKTVIVGHTPQASGQILDLGHVICIDTYCFGSGVLTALDVDTGQVWQADKSGQLRTD